MKVAPNPLGGAIPTISGAYYACYPGIVAATPSEGGTATPTWDTAILYVYFVGTKAPLLDEIYVARRLEYRWTAERMTRHDGLWITIPGCSCATIPTTLYMRSSNHVGNIGMFQDATLAWGPTPAWAAVLALGSSSFLSTTTFTDSTTGDQFYYHFSCSTGGAYFLTRVYQTSFYGSPYLDVQRYRWTVGLSGCTCGPPFNFPNGRVYAGGSAVTISLGVS